MTALVNGAILSALLTMGVWLALRITPRRALNAATRYAIWWIVLLATLALPLSFIQWPHQTATPVSAHIAQTIDPEPAPPIVALSSLTSRIALPIEIPASKWLSLILVAWIGSASLLLLRLALSYATLYRRTARAIPAAGARVALSDEIDIPMATGPFRRAILIPTKLFATICETDLDQIVRHEATHLARRDDYTLFLQRIAEALFPLHPVVRCITRQLDLEREIACDDSVARSTATARDYADCLTRMVQACGGVRPALTATAFADSRSHLSRRVELLMRTSRTGYPSLRRRTFSLTAIALIGAAAILAEAPQLVAFATPQIAPTPVASVTTLPVELPPVFVAHKPVVVAQATGPTPPQPEPPASPGPKLPLYILGPNDVVAITVYGENAVTGTYAISPRGNIALPLIGEIHAAGLTIPDLRALVSQKLSEYIVDPVVNVQLLRNNSLKYRVTGGVRNPGPYPLLKETTILVALAASGGLDRLAATDKIELLRGPEAPVSPSPLETVMSRLHLLMTYAQTFPFNYSEVIKGIHPEQNVTIQNGDVLFVPVE